MPESFFIRLAVPDRMNYQLAGVNLAAVVTAIAANYMKK